MFGKERHPGMGGIITLGIPLLAGNLSFYLLQVADTAMIGRLGTEALGAIAMAGLFTSILNTFIWPVSLGTQAIASRRFGKQHAGSGTGGGAKRTGEVLDNGILFGLFVSILSLIFSFLAGPILSLLIDDKALLPSALSYIRVVRWAMPISAISFAITGFLGSINETSDIMISNIGSNILNIVCNYIFIFGKLGLPPMGIRGAALGTVLATIGSALYLVLRIMSRRRRTTYRYLHFRSLSPAMLKDICRAALPPTIQNVIALTIFLVYEAMVGFLGTIYLAATHIIFSFFRINKTIVGGFARASAILVGNSLGAGDPEKADSYIKSCQLLGGIIGIVIFSLVLSIPGSLARLFSTDPETIAVTVRALRFFAPFFFIEVLGYSFEIIFTGNGWGTFVLASEFSTNVLFILVSTYICTVVLGMGMQSAWVSFALYQVFHALILTGGYVSRRWRNIEIEKS